MRLTPRLKDLIDAFNSRRDKDAIRLARTLIQDPKPAVRQEAQRILALCLFDAEKYDESSDLWMALFRDSDRPGDWLSLVTSLVRAKKFEEADHYFNLAFARFNEEVERITKGGGSGGKGMLTGAHLLFHYSDASISAGAPERALPKMEMLANLYASLAITDDSFLISRGMVPFKHFCSLAGTLFPLTRSSSHWKGIFNTLAGSLDENGRILMKSIQNP